MPHRVDEVECVEVQEGALLDDVRALLEAYRDWVASHAGFEEALEAQGFRDEVNGLPGAYAAPGGVLLAATVNGLVGGCIALRPLAPGVGEIKRLFVAPGYRGHSLGARLLEALVTRAEAMGVHTLRLDTLPFMNSAVKLYRTHGFVERPSYGATPLPGARYFERTIEAPAPRAELVTFQPAYSGDFERLNRQWLEEFFHVEEKDERVFRDPHAAMIAGGGEIFFVREGDRLVGTCAVAHHGDGVYELAKMAVDPASRGRGLGEWLVRHTITWARAAGARRLFLLSDERLPDALRLYERVGFRRAPFPGATGYLRGDVMMEFPLDAGA